MPGIRNREQYREPLVYWRKGTQYKTLLECSAPNAKGFCQIKLMSGEALVVPAEQLVYA